jgi:carboxylesterase type B
MVWIHGGGFIAGSGTSVMFGPDHLLTDDIVFVSINYRLGILGISDTNIYL